MNLQMFWKNILLELLREWRKDIPNKKNSIGIHGAIYLDMALFVSILFQYIGPLYRVVWQIVNRSFNNSDLSNL
jgi:hypothetical protein